MPSCSISAVEPPAARVSSPAGEVRFRLLVTLREYALERLEAGGEAQLVRQFHAEFCLVLAEQGQARLQGPEQDVWIDRLEHDQANFRAALQWWTEQGDVEHALRLSASLSRFWITWGYRTEGRERPLALPATLLEPITLLPPK